MKEGNEIKFNSKNKADIQAYLDYINIVGNDDNGKLMSEKEFENYKKNIKNQKREHYYVYWINSTGFECKVIGPESMCFCNHRYKYHDYNNTNNNKKKIKCKKCPCKCYEHVPCYGANDVKCLCHHSYREHDLFSRQCKRRNCKCQKFNSKFTCNCGEGYDNHKTVIYTKEERMKSGKPVEIGWYGESLINNGGGMHLENYGEMMNNIYDTEFKNMERKYDGKKIMYKNGVPINSNNNIRKNDLYLNSNNEYNNLNTNDNFLVNKNRCKSNDNFSKLKSMTYEEAFGLNKKTDFKNYNENEDNNNMKKYGGFIMNNKDFIHEQKKPNIYNNYNINSNIDNNNNYYLNHNNYNNINKNNKNIYDNNLQKKNKYSNNINNYYNDFQSNKYLSNNNYNMNKENNFF